MTDFEIKAIEKNTKVKFKEVLSFEIKKKKNNSGNHYEEAEFKIQINNEIYNAGFWLQNGSTKIEQVIEGKINYAMAAAECAKKGINNYKITLENIRWDREINGEWIPGEGELELFCKAFQNAAGGTWEALMATKILREAGQQIEIPQPYEYCNAGVVLEQSIRKKFTAIGFYKKTKLKRHKIKLKRIIDVLLPFGVKRLIKDGNYE